MENSKNLQDKDQYRKQIREMGERYDELQVQLFRTQGEVLALHSKLRKQKNPIQVVCTKFILRRVTMTCVNGTDESLFCSSASCCVILM